MSQSIVGKGEGGAAEKLLAGAQQSSGVSLAELDSHGKGSQRMLLSGELLRCKEQGGMIKHPLKSPCNHLPPPASSTLSPPWHVWLYSSLWMADSESDRTVMTAVREQPQSQLGWDPMSQCLHVESVCPHTAGA